MKEDKLGILSMELSVEVLNLVKELREKKENIISNQIGRSATSVCANIAESKYGQSRADFIAKLEIALKEATSQIIDTIHSVLEKTPPELAADIADRGIVLTGGGSLLRGLEDLIADKTGINTMTAEEPMTCVAVGTGKYVEFLSGKREEI